MSRHSHLGLGISRLAAKTLRDCRFEFSNAGKCNEYAPPLYARVLIVFGGRTGVPWLRWLRPGFRHCFAAVDDGAVWLTIDPLLHRLEVRASGLPSSFDLAKEYVRMGLTVIEVAPGPVPFRCAPVGLFTCVETVKRLLGLRARRVVTPWQLFRYLQSRKIQRSSRGRLEQQYPERSEAQPNENKTSKFS